MSSCTRGSNGLRLLDVSLDGRGTRFIPSVCNVSHGEIPKAVVGNVYTNQGDTGAGFLSRELDNFIYSKSNPALSREAQENTFKFFNKSVLVTHETPHYKQNTIRNINMDIEKYAIRSTSYTQCGFCHRENYSIVDPPFLPYAVSDQERYEEIIQRIDDDYPTESLFLTKPSGEHHHNVRRFDQCIVGFGCTTTPTDTTTHDLFLRWILEGHNISP